MLYGFELKQNDAIVLAVELEGNTPEDITVTVSNSLNNDGVYTKNGTLVTFIFYESQLDEDILFEVTATGDYSNQVSSWTTTKLAGYDPQSRFISLSLPFTGPDEINFNCGGFQYFDAEGRQVGGNLLSDQNTTVQVTFNADSAPISANYDCIFRLDSTTSTGPGSIKELDRSRAVPSVSGNSIIFEIEITPEEHAGFNKISARITTKP